MEAAPQAPAEDAAPCKGIPLTVMSWNVRFLPPAIDHYRRHRRIARLLRDCRPQVCCLQEVSPDLMRTLLDLLPEYHIFGHDRSGRGEDEAVPVLLRRGTGRVLAHETFWLGTDATAPRRAWDARHPRCATGLRLGLHGRAVSILSCHLDHRGRRARLEGAEQLAAWAARHAPAVLCGDLNTGPGSPAYQRLVGPPPLLQDARLVAARREGPDATWLAPGGLMRRRIDHLLVDHACRVQRHRTWVHTAGRRAPSDHRPIMIDLLL